LKLTPERGSDVFFLCNERRIRFSHSRIDIGQCQSRYVHIGSICHTSEALNWGETPRDRLPPQTRLLLQLGDAGLVRRVDEVSLLEMRIEPRDTLERPRGCAGFEHFDRSAGGIGISASSYVSSMQAECASSATDECIQPFDSCLAHKVRLSNEADDCA
jgi:hypothetical protein